MKKNIMEDSLPIQNTKDTYYTSLIPNTLLYSHTGLQKYPIHAFLSHKTYFLSLTSLQHTNVLLKVPTLENIQRVAVSDAGLVTAHG